MCLCTAQCVVQWKVESQSLLDDKSTRKTRSLKHYIRHILKMEGLCSGHRCRHLVEGGEKKDMFSIHVLLQAAAGKICM